MNLYPVDLILAVALAWGMVFHGGLPTRFLRAPVFRRPVGFAGIGWGIIALLSPASIYHYQLLVALVTLYAWWKLRCDDALGGKLWLAGAAALGIAFVPVLLLVVRPGAFPGELPAQVLFLASLYIGGAVIGLAAVLYVFTRRHATDAGIPPGLVESYGKLLVLLVLASFLIQGGVIADKLATEPPMLLIALAIFVLLVPVVWWARWRIRSPKPSRAGVPLLVLVVVGMAAEILFF